MSVRFWERIWRWGLAAIGLAALVAVNAPGAGSPTGGRPIEFSQPTNANDVVTTNLSRFKPMADLVPEFEPRAKEGMDFMRGEAAYGLSAPPPPLLVVPTKRLQERMDRRRSWALATPEEILLERSAALPGTDLEDDSKPSERQRKDGRPRVDQSNPRRRPDAVGPEAGEDSDDSAVARKRQDNARARDDDERDETSDEFKDNEKQLKDLRKELRKSLGEGTDSNPFFTVPAAAISLPNFFALDIQKPNPLEEASRHKAVMDEFSQMLDSPLNTSLYSAPSLGLSGPATELSPGFEAGKPAPLFASPFVPPDVGGSRADGAALSTGAADDALSGLFSGNSALSTPAQPVQTPTLAHPSPSFVFPKRAFQ